MKLIAEKQEFLTAAVTAARAAAGRSPVAVLEGLLLRAVEGAHEAELTGYDMRKGIRTRFPADVREGGLLVLNARVLGDLLRRLPEGDVSLSADDTGRTLIRGGRAEYEMQALDAMEYPELPELDDGAELELSRETLISMLDGTIYARSENESRPIYTGALFELGEDELQVVALDGFRLALRREKLETPVPTGQIQRFVVPGTALADLGRLFTTEKTLRVAVGTRHVRVEGERTELISRRLEGEFMDYRRSIPAGGGRELTAERESLLRCVDRVSLFVDDRTRHPLRCSFGDGELWVRCSTPMGRAEDMCELRGDGGGLEIGFNNRYLLDALRNAPAETLCLTVQTPTSPLVIRPADGSGSFLYMILPVRLRSD